jgi:hypothetical protein
MIKIKLKKKKKSHKMDTYWLKYCQIKSKFEGILVSIQYTQIHGLLVDETDLDIRKTMGQGTPLLTNDIAIAESESRKNVRYHLFQIS